MPEPSPTKISKLRIIAFGDSITEGTYGGANAMETYPAILEKLLKQKHIDAEVINKGIPGETAPEALFRLQRDVVDLKPDIVLIMFGANDAYIPPDFNFPAVSAENFSKAIGRMVDSLGEQSIKTILMTTTPFAELDFFDDVEKESLELNRQSLEMHLREVRKIANEKYLRLIDHYKTWQQLDKTNGVIKEYLPDGVHPNAKGNYLLAKTIFQALTNDAKLITIY
jgi:lysophospholipase L1-like esterase